MYISSWILLVLFQCSSFTEGSAVKELTKKDLETHSSKGFWIINFFAPWCKHCSKFAPEFEDASDKIKDIAGIPIQFGSMNIDQNRDLTVTFRITGLPTIRLYHEGFAIHDMSSYRSSWEILSFFTRFSQFVKSINQPVDSFDKKKLLINDPSRDDSDTAMHLGVMTLECTDVSCPEAIKKFRTIAYVYFDKIHSVVVKNNGLATDEAVLSFHQLDRQMTIPFNQTADDIYRMIELNRWPLVTAMNVPRFIELQESTHKSGKGIVALIVDRDQSETFPKILEKFISTVNQSKHLEKYHFTWIHVKPLNELLRRINVRKIPAIVVFEFQSGTKVWYNETWLKLDDFETGLKMIAERTLKPLPPPKPQSKFNLSSLHKTFQDIIIYAAESKVNLAVVMLVFILLSCIIGVFTAKLVFPTHETEAAVPETVDPASGAAVSSENAVTEDAPSQDESKKDK